ncbi:MAG: hypothetical protein COB36_11375 [Alphaproteobacteria bacterium]|nr:MAG: hypothetical protein COB36_11375 [Alphaproteobacteria bacterium]
MQSKIQGTVGELIGRFLEACDVQSTFGVISIHNMPILDAIGERGKIRFIPSRGEAGAANMADAYARVTGNLGVVFTSTGTAAGNAAGAMVEALTAGSPLLHITGQIEVEHLDKNRGYIHEAPAQLDMLKSVSKAAFRIGRPEEAFAIMREAVRVAQSAPTGPVSIEIPIDVQQALVDIPQDLSPVAVTAHPISPEDVKRVAQNVIASKRPMIWLGGGTRHASVAATRLADMGIAIVSSTNGRAVVAEDHPMTLGAFNASAFAETLYNSLDMMIVVGSRLRSNETWTYKITLPENMTVVDCDPTADKRCYPNKDFVCGDAGLFLEALADEVEGKLAIDPTLAVDIQATKEKSVAALKDALGPYGDMVDRLQDVMPENTVWVRDVTISNSMWGNRMLRISGPRDGVHALGGGIGQGLPMGVGAAVAATERGDKTIALTGDGGLCLCMGEFACAAEENVDMTLLIMNDNGYGVIRNIQDVQYGSRKHYSNIKIPDYGDVAKSLGISYVKIRKMTDFGAAMAGAIDHKGFSIVEVDMVAIGPFKKAFAGPPVRT